MPPAPYADVLARNLRAVRAALDISQADVAARMQALGFGEWRRQTVARVEKAGRRLAAEEVFALSYVLETTILRLVRPAEESEWVAFPSGRAVHASSVVGSARGARDMAIRWDGNTPVFFEGGTHWPAGFRDVFDPAADDQRAAAFIDAQRPDPDG